MKITIARTAGFCMGVRRAVDLVLDASNATKERICTYGPLIHNPQVLEMLEKKGIPSINTIPEKGEGTVLIRAHGVPPQDKRQLELAGFKVIDATCPRVIRVQTIIKKHTDQGYASIILGDRDHPEVKGLLGYAGKGGVAVSSLAALEKLPSFDRAIIVAQTTQDTHLFEQVKVWAQENHPEYKVFDTICDSTEKRQAETRKMAQICDAVVVVGGRESGNTRRLAQVARDTGKPAFHIEDVSELDIKELAGAKHIAITAGASTPNWIINKTCRTLENQLGKPRNFLLAKLRPLVLVLLRTNLLISLGAGCLTFACATLQGVDHSLSHSATAMLYILSMQVINNLFSIKSDLYNNPDRAMLYMAHRPLLIALALVSGSAGLFLTFATSLTSFAILLVMSLLGLSYNLKILPTTTGFKRIKDIPASRTLLITAAWGTVTCILPAISTPTGMEVVPALVFSMGLVLARTAFFDVLQMQGDRITGKETLPILVGEQKTLSLITWVLAVTFLSTLVSTLVGLITPSGFVLMLVPISMGYAIHLSKKDFFLPGTQLEIVIESQFIIAGIVSLLF
ncbi:IspH [Desulforapulum autotrophicum HRM2]|uniref:4-hydroxy-3-methylbut-2-enyl diphosphate reductase n=1 Tax=Desulforapulum autotrophicum (strain ATCC 43914 / DSM 3382 / VKM B-1955 / HRM2) TaxID=177437 RepID=C0QLG6_DESAH|nr:4-hydroxy-3-methylbut-2-enyl diphosphate reductase [Desulforapulum autotrophicum]ACN16270.1 IspH [Desulforapulum autotrophicum HRM2]